MKQSTLSPSPSLFLPSLLFPLPPSFFFPCHPNFFFFSLSLSLFFFLGEIG
jgi:hypothetical protein